MLQVFKIYFHFGRVYVLLWGFLDGGAARVVGALGSRLIEAEMMPGPCVGLP